ncbi:glycosyltransferase family protein [Bordetella hinzii]|uniref:glycosyltransferase family protein n=1 Tax=Bordetella hinzii TaxID=103855 RepID=UPI001C02C10F|nr:glycosyltransferase [Bordetella hinzii]QWF45429.1 glycosyltransferase [Bordetella hinzii]
MQLSEQFDAVVMLTWSDWKTEPRSNRYHYATRFAKSLPVLFLQHRYQQREGIEIEASEHPNLDLVHVSCGVKPDEIQDFKRLLNARGIKRPLVWIYDSMNYHALIDALPRGFLVYHATEDYLTHSNVWNQSMEVLATSLKRLLARVDFMVACAPEVARTYLTAGGYQGPYSVIENGCDAEYFIELADRFPSRPVDGRPVALFQGGINKRVDYSLLLDLVKRMPEWEFRFCGAAQPDEAWTRLTAQPNVNYLGALAADDVAKQMYDATVGLIPYIQDQWIKNSYPLKAYEYVACGLPVVSVPVTSLENEPRLFSFATTAKGFQEAIEAQAATRHDKAMLELRREAARRNSYDGRFAQMQTGLLPAVVEARQQPKRLRVAMLYDSMSSMHVNTISEHLEAFEKYSRHEVIYLPCTSDFWQQSPESVDVDLSPFDVAVVHYSVRLSVRSHLDEGIARALEKFTGLKVLFIQDEYEGTEIARAWMDRLRFDLVYTCVPQEGLETVYPSYRFPATEFLPTLTGYVPERAGLEQFGRPLEERKLAIAYRGRALDPVYGELGQEKYRIGVEMKIITTMRGLPVDIETDDQKRIYGDAWYEFLGSARATLGTESGSNVFDYDGSLRKTIRQLKASDPEISFKTISEQVLAGHEGQVHMNQISPKVFEAIRLRTALILFEGDYSGVVKPNEHFIPLKKDFSNVDEVLEKLADDAYLTELTERAYTDVVASQKFSYRTFIRNIDLDFEARILHSKFDRPSLRALFYLDGQGQATLALPLLPTGLWTGAHPLGAPPSVTLRAPVPPVDALIPPALAKSLPVRAALKAWRLLPQRVRRRLHGPARRTAAATYRKTSKLAKGVWTRLPVPAKRVLRKLLGR